MLSKTASSFEDNTCRRTPCVLRIQRSEFHKPDSLSDDEEMRGERYDPVPKVAAVAF
jgi:hypothetical protein